MTVTRTFFEETSNINNPEWDQFPTPGMLQIRVDKILNNTALFTWLDKTPRRLNIRDHCIAPDKSKPQVAAFFNKDNRTFINVSSMVHDCNCRTFLVERINGCVRTDVVV